MLQEIQDTDCREERLILSEEDKGRKQEIKDQFSCIINEDKINCKQRSGNKLLKDGDKTLNS